MMSFALTLLACGNPDAAPSAPPPAPAPATTPAPAAPAAPIPSDPKGIAAELARLLDGRTDTAGFAAITAPVVELTFERQCGESPKRTLTSRLKGDTRLQLAWGMFSAGSGCGPGDARCPDLPVKTDPERLSCDGTCCEVQNIGHGALWVRGFCTAEGRVTTIRVEDGC